MKQQILLFFDSTVEQSGRCATRTFFFFWFYGYFLQFKSPADKCVSFFLQQHFFIM